MELMDAQEWAAKYFTERSRPDNRTIRDWVDQRILPGVIIGPRKVYIDESEWLKRVKSRRITAAKVVPHELTGDPLVDSVLKAV